MASGKTTVGRLVATATWRRLVDVDDVIEARTGLTVRRLWERDGEAGYRPIERDVVLEVLAEGGPVVLATPAGAVLDESVQAAFEAAEPFVVWLRARPETLAARVDPADHRPLLEVDPLGVLTRQAAERAGTYEALADLVVDIDDLPPDQIADRIVAALGGRA